MGGLQAKSMTSQRNRAEPSQYGGYALLCSTSSTVQS